MSCHWRAAAAASCAGGRARLIEARPNHNGLARCGLGARHHGFLLSTTSPNLRAACSNARSRSIVSLFSNHDIQRGHSAPAASTRCSKLREGRAPAPYGPLGCCQRARALHHALKLRLFTSRSKTRALLAVTTSPPRRLARAPPRVTAGRVGGRRKPGGSNGILCHRLVTGCRQQCSSSPSSAKARENSSIIPR